MSHAAGHMSQISSMTTRPSTVLSAHTLAPVNDASSGLLLNGAQGSELVERNQNSMRSWMPSHCRLDQRHKISVPNQRGQINVGQTGDVCLRAPNQRHEALDAISLAFQACRFGRTRRARFQTSCSSKFLRPSSSSDGLEFCEPNCQAGKCFALGCPPTSVGVCWHRQNKGRCIGSPFGRCPHSNCAYDQASKTVILGPSAATST